MNVFVRRRLHRCPVKAVVLDWAGTAVDYGCVAPVDAFIEAFARRGVDITEAETRGPMGLRKLDHVRALCNLSSVTTKWRELFGRDPNEDDIQAMFRDTEQLMVASVADHAELIPGLLTTVEFFREKGIKIGTSTGYTRPVMDALIPEAARRGYRPDSIVCSSDVPGGRPFPFMCYRNAINLEVYPLQAMVKIGDTTSDILEGLNAGMWTIGITKSGSDLGLTEAEAAALSDEEMLRTLAVVESRFLEAGAHFVADDIGQCPAIIEAINALLSEGEVP